MEKGSKVTSYLKNTMESFLGGVAKSVVGSSAVVPALAPIPVNEVDTSFGSLETIEKPEEEEKYQEVVKEKIAKVAEEKSLPYEEEPEVSLKKGGIVEDRTIAEVGEGGEAEAVIPLSKYGKSIESVYREGASLLISSSIGFLQTLPASPAKGSVLAEANKLKSVFGISKTVKPAFKIGLKQELQWWGGVGGGATTGGAMAPEEKKESAPDSGGSGGFRLPDFKKLRKRFRKFRKSKPFKKAKKFLSKGKGKVGKAFKKLSVVGKKAGKGLSKVAKQGKGLVKGVSKAGKSLLKKGIKKIGAKVGGKAIAKVGAKALGKGLLKKIPFVGLGAGLLFAGQRLMKGDFKGAMLEAASGIAGTIPGVGTAVSIGLDATLAAKDMGILPDQKKAEEQASGLTTPNAAIDSLGKPIVLNPPTMKAWKRAVNAAAKDGINLPNSVTSSYRSPEQQAALVSAAQAGDPNAITPAAPGNSPHGQGWAVDIQFGSKASEWMREKGKKYGFQWQGEDDPVHFDFINGEDNDKWLRKGKNKWLPDIPPEESKVSSSGSIKTPSASTLQSSKRFEEFNDLIEQGYSPEEADKLSLEKFPLQIGDRESGGGGGVNTMPTPPKVVYIPVPTYQKNRRKNQWGRNETNVLDPHGKGNAQLAYAS
jgi:hypothetical protein